jgi:hypothetical protein
MFSGHIKRHFSGPPGPRSNKVTERIFWAPKKELIRSANFHKKKRAGGLNSSMEHPGKFRKLEVPKKLNFTRWKKVKEYNLSMRPEIGPVISWG